MVQVPTLQRCPISTIKKSLTIHPNYKYINYQYINYNYTSKLNYTYILLWFDTNPNYVKDIFIDVLNTSHKISNGSFSVRDLIILLEFLLTSSSLVRWVTIPDNISLSCVLLHRNLLFICISNYLILSLVFCIWVYVCGLTKICFHVFVKLPPSYRKVVYRDLVN